MIDWLSFVRELEFEMITIEQDSLNPTFRMNANSTAATSCLTGIREVEAVES